MNRTLVRLIGGCAAVFGGVVAAHGAVERFGYSNVETNVTKYNGFFSSVQKCGSRTTVSDERCGNGGICDPDGTYCPNSGYFLDLGCVHHTTSATDSAPCVYKAGVQWTVGSGRFLSCENGFYVANPGGSCGNVACYSIVQDSGGPQSYTGNMYDFAACCRPCPVTSSTISSGEYISQTLGGETGYFYISSGLSFADADYVEGGWCGVTPISDNNLRSDEAGCSILIQDLAGVYTESGDTFYLNTGCSYVTGITGISF